MVVLVVSFQVRGRLVPAVRALAARRRVRVAKEAAVGQVARRVLQRFAGLAKTRPRMTTTQL